MAETIIPQNSDLSCLHNSNLLKSLIHDFRNYVFGIGGIANMMLENKSEEDVKNSEDLQMIRMIAKQSEELEMVVNRLLNQEVQQFNNCDYCDVNQVIKEVLILNQKFAQDNKITLSFADENKQIKLNQNQINIKQILTNLIINSIKYSNENSIVKVSTYYSSTENKLIIKVEDNGIGMTKDEIKMALKGDGKKIDKSNLRKNFTSNGIGLPSVKRMIDEMNNAKLEIASQKNVGTCISLIFELIKQK